MLHVPAAMLPRFCSGAGTCTVPGRKVSWFVVVFLRRIDSVGIVLLSIAPAGGPGKLSRCHEPAVRTVPDRHRSRHGRSLYPFYPGVVSGEVLQSTVRAVGWRKGPARSVDCIYSAFNQSVCRSAFQLPGKVPARPWIGYRASIAMVVLDRRRRPGVARGCAFDRSGPLPEVQ